jgi:hypothetical protein
MLSRAPAGISSMLRLRAALTSFCDTHQAAQPASHVREVQHKKVQLSVASPATVKQTAQQRYAWR